MIPRSVPRFIKFIHELSDGLICFRYFLNVFGGFSHTSTLPSSRLVLFLLRWSQFILYLRFGLIRVRLKTLPELLRGISHFPIKYNKHLISYVGFLLFLKFLFTVKFIDKSSRTPFVRDYSYSGIKEAFSAFNHSVKTARIPNFTQFVLQLLRM